MRVRIVRKLADRVDGIDITNCDVGDLIDLRENEAYVMVAERWAVPARRRGDSAGLSRSLTDRRQADDLYARLRNKRDDIERERRHLNRRASDAA